MQPRSRKSSMMPVRCEQNGISFDSKAERAFYLKLCSAFSGYTILRPCEVVLTGKIRKWKCDFGIYANNARQIPLLSRIASKCSGIECTTDVLYVEFKGGIDIQTGLLKLDQNFIKRVNHLVRYEPSILRSTICVGLVEGAILTYCANKEFRATPVHSKEYFFSLVGEK